VIRVVERTVLPVPAARVWWWMADLERLVTADVLHQSVSFVGPRRAGAGTVMVVPHGLRLGPRMRRRIRVTQWEPGRRIRWTDVEVSPTLRRYVFPHAEEFVLTPLGDSATLLTDTVTGSLNLRIPLVGALAERLLERLVVRRVVHHQARTLRQRIR
jgi:hypothetical protein